MRRRVVEGRERVFARGQGLLDLWQPFAGQKVARSQYYDRARCTLQHFFGD
jgi:hypothetical protein